MLSVGAIPLDAATTVTPAWTEPGRGYDRYPSVDEPLGAVMTVTLMWLNLWARLRPLPLRECTFGRGYDRYPRAEWTLGEIGSSQNQPCSRSQLL